MATMKLTCPDRWPGELTEDKLREIVQGLLIPSPEMSRRLAWELLTATEAKDDK